MPPGLIAAYALTALSGVALAIQDIRHGKVTLPALAAFLVGGILVFCFTSECSFAPLAIFVCIGGLYFLTKKKPAFGSADYIVVTAASFLLPHKTWPLFLLLCGAFGIASALALKTRRFPFIPAILLAAAACAVVRSWM
jgi:hypothetical protein